MQGAEQKYYSCNKTLKDAKIKVKIRNLEI
jgi:hypothetical protein